MGESECNNVSATEQNTVRNEGLTIFVLEEERRATAANHTAGHDGNPITQQVGFIHEVCRQ